jgi:predicted GTPase
MAEQSLLAIEEADVVLFMVDARAGLMPADTAIAKHLRSREKPTFLVANKTDGIDADQAIADFWSLGSGISIRSLRSRSRRDQPAGARPAAVGRRDRPVGRGG